MPLKKVAHATLLAMRAKLHTDEGRRRYAQRKQTIEPVFGIMKHVLGLLCRTPQPVHRFLALAVPDLNNSI